VTFNGPVELRHGIFTTNGNVTFNGLVSLNPGNDEIGFKPSGGAPEQISTAAALGASGLTSSALANCNNAGVGCAAGSPQILWDYVTARVTVSTTGSGTINFANGAVWGGGTTSASLANSVKYFHGEQTGTTRAALVAAPIRHFVLNLKTDPASSVSFNGVLGYSAAKPGDLPNTGHPLSNNLFPSADNSFQIGAVTGSVSAAGASGSVDTYTLNGVNTTTGLGTATIAGFVSPSLPGNTGTLITPAPNNANAAGIAPTFLSEISLPAAPPTVVAGTTTAAAAATQEANAASSSASNAANQVVREEAHGGSEADGRGPSQTADLGRGGSTTDVFGQNFHVANGGRAGPSADTEYFSETPFQSAERRRRRQ
jgi:hypothetical protein